ncbi:MAG: hypothetical protein Q8830_03650 [Candidatus Phytoplasma australasiaticum]|nr:hypothetical protein [Candidatus Phytoplasma australasiaticum]
MSRVTLHNYNYIQNKDIRINDSVIIVKSGSIILNYYIVYKSSDFMMIKGLYV